MPEYTPNLNLYLPGGGGSGTIPDEIADIDKLNENFRLIDASIGGSVVPAKAGYTNRFNGNLVFARNERKLFMESSADGGLLDISPGANFYKGTSVEREAFKGYAENGDAWRDTDASKGLYIKGVSAWEPFGPVHAVSSYVANPGAKINPIGGIAIKTGMTSTTTSSAGVIIHDFGTGFPTACIGVVLLPNNNKAGGVVVEDTVSKNGFQTFWAGAGSVTRAIHWMAFGY